MTAAADKAHYKKIKWMKESFRSEREFDEQHLSRLALFAILQMNICQIPANETPCNWNDQYAESTQQKFFDPQ